MHERFEWNETKARANQRKHGADFDIAAEVLADPFADLFHLSTPQRRGHEDRWLTLGSHPARRSIVLAIVWRQDDGEGAPATRIISARKATRKEREHYEQEVFHDRS